MYRPFFLYYNIPLKEDRQMTEGILIGITLCTAFTALILILCTMVGLMALDITYYKNNFITVDAETWNTVADAYNEKVEAEGEAEGGIGGFFRECIEEDIEEEEEEDIPEEEEKKKKDKKKKGKK